MDAVSATISLSRRSSSSAPFLTDSSESAASWYAFALSCECGDASTHLAERVKDGVEVDEYLALGDFRDVVEALSGEVPDPVLGIREAYEQRFHELLHIRRNIHAQSNGRSSKSNETPIAYM